MKIFITLLLTITTLLSGAAASANETRPQPVMNLLITTGQITELADGKMTIDGSGNFDRVTLHTAKAHLYDSNGNAAALADFKIGDTVDAYYGPRLTRSIPPQGQAVAIIKNDVSVKAPHYLKVSEVETVAGGGIRVLSDNRDQLVTILPAICNQLSDIAAGSELLLWYDMMTLSLPGQSTATKAVVITSAAELLLNTADNTVFYDHSPIILQPGESLTVIDDVVYAPLRTLGQSLGYDVIWNDGLITLANQTRRITMTIGDVNCGDAKKRVLLNAAPRLIDGRAYAPQEFFHEILKLKVTVTQ